MDAMIVIEKSTLEVIALIVGEEDNIKFIYEEEYSREISIWVDYDQTDILKKWANVIDADEESEEE